jgi:hypothetical protein
MLGETVRHKGLTVSLWQQLQLKLSGDCHDLNICSIFRKTTYLLSIDLKETPLHIPKLTK